LKYGSALSILLSGYVLQIAGYVLQIAGYVPGADQRGQVHLAMSVIIFAIPIAGCILGALSSREYLPAWRRAFAGVLGRHLHQPR
jgi:Na+/melibiose symporter-like transporter